MKLFAIIKTYHISAPNEEDALNYFNILETEEKPEYEVATEVIEVLN